MENAKEDLNSVIGTEEILAKELKEFEVIENFKSLFNAKKKLLGELGEINRKKIDILKKLKKFLNSRDDKEKELKQLDELIEKEKEMYPTEYEEYRMFG